LFCVPEKKRRNKLTAALPGLVVKAQSGFFTVELEDGRKILTQIPGRLKVERKDANLVAAGDRVTITINPDGTGVIESVAERSRVLSRARPAPDRRSLQSDQEQVLVANPDQMVSVFSIRKPRPSLRKLDRFLVVAEMNQLLAVVCVNKIDLVDPGQAQETFAPYADLGYKVIYTSAIRGDGIEELRDSLKDKISVMTGSSGVGKTSLLNAIQPGLGRIVKDVSEATEKGLHTTRYVELVPLIIGGYVADTPGIRALALFDLEPGELDGYFREIAPLVANCQFSDCTHRHEPKCAVRSAVADGLVSPERYDSYLRIREEHELLEESEF
jgi:ribosome biogenesis GTPase